MEAVLETDRLVLQRFAAGDADGLAALDINPAVMRFLGPVRSRAESGAEVLPRLMSCHTRHPGFGYWAARIRGGGELAGWFGLRPMMPDSAPIVDWREAPQAKSRWSSWATGCGAAPGDGDTPRKEPGRWSTARSPSLTSGGWSPQPWPSTLPRGRALEIAGLRYVRTLHLHWPDPTRCPETSTETLSMSYAGTTGGGVRNPV